MRKRAMACLGRRAGFVLAAAAIFPVMGLGQAAQARSAGAAARHALLPVSDILQGVAAASGHSVWAVGDYVNRKTGNRHAMIQHWNGKRWSKVASPAEGAFSSLQGVAATRSQAWAVGNFAKSGKPSQTLIERWNGRSWRRVPSPSIAGTETFLDSVAIVSRSNAWAVGEYISGPDKTLIEHWNGHRWKIVASPSVAGRFNFLRAVVSGSSGSLFTVGDTSALSSIQTLADQWTGAAWQQTTSVDVGTTSSLYGAADFNAFDVYAVGLDVTSGTEQTLIENWSGGVWTQVASPNEPSATGSFLMAAAPVRSTGDAWAVGGYNTGGVGQTLTEEQQGGVWSIVASPDVGGATAFNTLTAVTVASTGNAWAVGAYHHDSAEFGLILHWNGHSWKHIPSPNS
jgi:hypothetical protein